MRVLVFEADAGMGKTVIAAAAVAALERDGHKVVRAPSLLCFGALACSTVRS